MSKLSEFLRSRTGKFLVSPVAAGYEWGRKKLKPKVAPEVQINPLTGQEVQSLYGVPNVAGSGSRPGAGVSGTSGMYGGLGELPGYQDPTSQYQAVTPPPGLSSEQKRAWIAEQAAAQERQASLRRNMARRDAILAGYDQSIANNRRFADLFDQQYSGYGASQRQALERDRLQQLARASGSARRRGLGNTTIRDSLNRGVESDYQQQRTGLEDQLIQNRINLNAQALARENQLTGQRLNFLTGIQDQGPSFEQVIGYGMMPSQLETAQNTRNLAQANANKQFLGNLGVGLVDAVLPG